MNKLISNNLLRLQHEMTFLHGEGITPNGMAEILGIKKSIIYDDLIAMNNESQFTLEISMPWDVYLENRKQIVEEYKKNGIDEGDIKIGELLNDCSETLLSDPKFASLLKSGAYDNYTFRRGSIIDSVEVILSSDELDTLNSFLNKDEGRSFMIKNSNRLRSEDLVDMVNYLLAVIKDGSSIEFSYKAKSQILKKTIRPIKIIHNTTEDTYYVFDHKGVSYNMDNILPLSIRDSNVKQNIARNIDEKRFEKMWGVNYSENGVRVKLKIYNEGKVIERVKNDLGSKLNDTNFTLFKQVGNADHIISESEEGADYAIFEDEVIGTEVFLSWVYSYGSSMILLEPRELVDKVLDSIKKRKEMYLEDI